MYYSFDTQDRRDGAVVTFVRLDKLAKRFRKPLLPRPSSFLAQHEKICNTGYSKRGR